MTENTRQEMLKDIRDGHIDAWDIYAIDELFEQIQKEHIEIQELHAIGTIEEFKALKEKIEKVEFILNEKKYTNSEECDYGNYDICDNALRIKDIEKIING